MRPTSTSHPRAPRSRNGCSSGRTWSSCRRSPKPLVSPVSASAPPSPPRPSPASLTPSRPPTTSRTQRPSSRARRWRPQICASCAPSANSSSPSATACCASCPAFLASAASSAARMRISCLWRSWICRGRWAALRAMSRRCACTRSWRSIRASWCGSAGARPAARGVCASRLGRRGRWIGF